MDVYLDSFKFSPAPRQKISYNNPRVLAKLDIPGAAPSYQDMGEDGTVVSWSGVLTGNAYASAVQLENMKNTGKPVQLRVTDCPELSIPVRISKFEWDFVRKDYVSYSIELFGEPPESPLEPVIVSKNTSSVQSVTVTPVKTYTVVAGDTLWAISSRFLSKPTRWTEIAKLNGIADERKLQIGTVLKIPS
ncbi:Peptidoglycan-binding lysin domain protein [Syntrophobotulus glycolicus DSM 8271]|uniref:Peptidoglycan-binding lysin domain protein n=1 Tax=Syntrophobotulus glycolicus (strain DSM 8271 / FlGlyR) TaxID=645991 RepID=F0T175_SYNGF|nr:LysM domain-containing protein [Syntrophobotulus glycolicus]ADY55139.1 Peptidoglycan-binding lysin domain protein [Syntrophobotulus glycolicus DSM 8271]